MRKSDGYRGSSGKSERIGGAVYIVRVETADGVIRGAAVDLDGFDGVWHLFEDLVEKAGGVLAVACLHGLATVHLANGS